MNVKHTIQQLIFEIEGFENNTQFQNIASKISSLVRTTIQTQLNTLFNQYNIEGHHIIIEELELDLKYINVNNLAHNLTYALRAALRKHLNRIHVSAQYEIKHAATASISKNISTLDYILEKETTFSKVLAKKQIHTSYQLNRDPKHYFPSVANHKVVPEDARYFDAVIHYLEYGWIPRYLDIPMLEFDQVLVDTLSNYGQEILSHFGRKPKNQSVKITERIIRQTSKNKLLKKNKKASKVLASKLLGVKSDEQIQAFISILDHISTGSQSFTTHQKESLKVWAKELSVTSAAMDTILTTTEATVQKTSFNIFEDLDSRIDAILDSRDKTLFNQLLETNFYKSLVTSYVSKTDSHSLILRTLIPIILYPSQKDRILKTVPEILESENELINQLYAKSPYLVNKSILSLKNYTKSPIEVLQKVSILFNSLSKKQVNHIVKSFFSHYDALATQLNFINRSFDVEDQLGFTSFIFKKLVGIEGQNIRSIDTIKLSQAHVVSLLILQPRKSPAAVVSEYVKAIQTYTSTIIKAKQLARIFKNYTINEKVKGRTYSKLEKSDMITFESLEQEQKLLGTGKSAEIVRYQMQTLLKHYYLPKAFTSSSSVQNLIDEMKLTAEEAIKLQSEIYVSDAEIENIQEQTGNVETENQEIVTSKQGELQSDHRTDPNKPEISDQVSLRSNDKIDHKKEGERGTSNFTDDERKISKKTGEVDSDSDSKEGKKENYIEADRKAEIKGDGQLSKAERKRADELNKKRDSDNKKSSKKVVADQIKSVQKEEELKQEDKSFKERQKLIEKQISGRESVDTLISNIKKYKVPQKVLLKNFTEANILKNPVLAKISSANFRELLATILPTSKARLYKRLYEKYERFFKINIDTPQIQLIFLSLLKYHEVLDETNIFRYFYEELKTFKGWTYDKHKEKLIQMYEKRAEDLSKDEKDQYVKYVDSLPTYLGLEMKDTKKKLEEGVPIKNAGLCLLWPFFKTLFSVSGYLDPKGDFKSREMRERATLLLQYLAVKSTAIEEPYLALNKIFTGLPLDESLPSEIVLTEKEKDIADALLLNVIKQWPSFSNSSTDNLRGSFIIRDGVLFFRGKQWVLRVENKAYDLLLNKLPWGFSMIRLSWIPYIIKVEWN